MYYFAQLPSQNTTDDGLNNRNSFFSQIRGQKKPETEVLARLVAPEDSRENLFLGWGIAILPSSFCMCLSLNSPFYKNISHMGWGPHFKWPHVNLGFLDGSVGKESTCNSRDTGDVDSIPGWEDLLRRKWQLLQCSCLGNFLDRGV